MYTRKIKINHYLSLLNTKIYPTGVGLHGTAVNQCIHALKAKWSAQFGIYYPHGLMCMLSFYHAVYKNTE